MTNGTNGPRAGVHVHTNPRSVGVGGGVLVAVHDGGLVHRDSASGLGRCRGNCITASRFLESQEGVSLLLHGSRDASSV